MEVSQLLHRAARAAALIAVGCAAGAANAAPAQAATCAWQAQVSPETVNLLYPDFGARYWVAVVPVPRDGRLELSGRYPYARYLSLVSYAPNLSAIDSLADTAIDPEPGSANPFRRGADRTVTARDWRVRVVDQRLPAAGRVPNTLYLQAGSLTSLRGLAVFALRIYQPDDGRDAYGGTGLPAITQFRSDGSRRTLRTCPQGTVPRIRGLPPALLAQLLRAGGPLVVPLELRGHNPPVWRKHTNIVTAFARLYLDTARTPRLGEVVMRGLDSIVPPGGLAENPDNSYVAATYARGFGEVLLLRGRMPTIPRTRGGEPVMAAGQLRYWSLCTGAQDTSTYGCLIDDEVPLDAQRDFAIVISPARPANARPGCGIAWLPSGPVAQSLLIMRNMLPDPGFAGAIQRARVGSEAATMGPYLPRGTYYRDMAAFEREVGCPG